MLSKWISEREITDADEIERLLNETEICRVAFEDGEFPYVVPMCFGYDLNGGKLELFFRRDNKGREIDLIKENNRAAFEIDSIIRHKRTEDGGGYSIPVFRSVNGKGVIEVITGIEKLTVLGHIMRKFGDAPDGKKIPEQHINALTVLKLTVTKFCCREHNAE